MMGESVAPEMPAPTEGPAETGQVDETPVSQELLTEAEARAQAQLQERARLSATVLTLHQELARIELQLKVDGQWKPLRPEDDMTSGHIANLERRKLEIQAELAQIE